MSSWTYITGHVEVAPPGRGDHAKLFVLNEVLDHLPLVPGSEGPMRWYVVRSDEYSGSSNHDEFLMRSNLHGRYGWWEHHDVFYVVLEAKLRDTFYEGTVRAFVKWLTRLSKRVHVEDVLVRVSGQKKNWRVDDLWKSHTFDGAGYFEKMHHLEREEAVGEGLDIRRSSNWRYELMPEGRYWPDILVNLLPGGMQLARDYDLINGNLIDEEYFEYLGWDNENGKALYGGIEPDISETLAEHSALFESLMRYLKFVNESKESLTS